VTTSELILLHTRRAQKNHVFVTIVSRPLTAKDNPVLAVGVLAQAIGDGAISAVDGRGVPVDDVAIPGIVVAVPADAYT